jgi:hypothetical protein
VGTEFINATSADLDQLVSSVSYSVNILKFFLKNDSWFYQDQKMGNST